MMKKVCMFVTNPVVGDPRVMREVETLVRDRFDVVVIGLGGSDTQLEVEGDGYRIIRVRSPLLYTMRQAIVEGLKYGAQPIYRMLRSVVRMMYRGRQTMKMHMGMPLAPQTTVVLPPDRMYETWWDKLKTDVLAIRCIFWINIEMARLAIEENADVYHAHDLDTLLAGFLAKRRMGKPLVYDFHELYTEQFQPGTKSFIWRLTYCLLEWWLIKHVDYSLTVCDSLSDWVAKRYNVPRAMTVRNIPNSLPVSQVRVTRSAEVVIVFHGGYASDRGLEIVIEAARHLDKGRIVLRGFGPIEGKLRALAAAAGNEQRVVFAKPVPMSNLVQAASEADIGLVPYLPACLNNEYCLPNKIFEYMMAGLAVVGSDLPELRRIISEHDVGRVYRPYDAKHLAEVLNELMADHVALARMKENALRAAKEIFNWTREEQKLIDLYTQVVAL